MSVPRVIPGIVGFAAVTVQIVLMRELIVAFNGNEISLGIMLATWLLWTAGGSGLASRLALGRSNARRAVAVLECLLAISLPPSIWVLRVSRTFFQTVPGELLGPLPMLLTSVLCLSAVCVLLGGLFVAAARMYEQEMGVSTSAATSSAYLLEAAGSACGGVLASVALLRFLDSFHIVCVVALLNLVMAFILWFRVRGKWIAATIVAATMVAIPVLANVAPSLDRSSLQRMWIGFRVLASHTSIYGNLVVTETGAIRSIYDNGVILASAPDPSAAEEAVHYALLEHTAPKKILLIGGGVNGSILQALQHPTLERLDYVEMDPSLLTMWRQFFPAQPLPSDPRVHIHHTDGRLYLSRSSDAFDVILLNLPNPQTAQLNRFYTVEFFRSARRHLSSGGVLALQLRSSEDYISPQLADFLRCIDRTLREVFPNTVTIPGETTHFFAALGPDILTDNPQTLISRLRARQLETRYVREYFIPFRMMPDRMAQLHMLLEPRPTTPVNRDFEPIAYYFDVVLWSAQFRSGFSNWFQAAARIRFTEILNGVIVSLLSLAILLAYAPGVRRRVRTSAASCVAATGFTLMALQIFLLLAFQSIYGYVYHQLAILIAMFMAGIALGSWLGLDRGGKGQPKEFLKVAAVIQFLLALAAPALLLLLPQLAHGFWTAQVVFPACAAICGMLGGYQFPIASEIYVRHGPVPAGPGVLYALDLLGGCAGALLLSTYLIPVFGFWKTAWLTAAVNLAPALLAVRVCREAKMARA